MLQETQLMFDAVNIMRLFITCTLIVSRIILHFYKNVAIFLQFSAIQV